MSKRKAKPLPSGVTVECMPEQVGKGTLVACPTCGGFGGVMLDDGDWKVCDKCRGDGRVWKESE